jgi:hypothetical protein
VSAAIWAPICAAAEAQIGWRNTMLGFAAIEVALIVPEQGCAACGNVAVVLIAYLYPKDGTLQEGFSLAAGGGSAPKADVLLSPLRVRFFKKPKVERSDLLGVREPGETQPF